MNIEELNNLAIDVGNIGNYYGGLSISNSDGKYYWSIENWDGNNWSEIDKKLYNQLLKHKR